MVIIINGAINAGKSTVSKLLAQKIPNTANIEVDHLRGFVDFLELTQELININLINAAKVANTFHANQINAVISYPLLDKDLDLLVKNLDAITSEIRVFTLNPKLSSLVINRGKRELEGWEIKRTKQLHKLITKKPLYGNVVIDNTDQTPEETTQKILEFIGI